MALHQTTLESRVRISQDLVRGLIILAAVVVLLLVATYVFGVGQIGPSYELTPDPAGVALPF